MLRELEHPGLQDLDEAPEEERWTLVREEFRDGVHETLKRIDDILEYEVRGVGSRIAFIQRVSQGQRY